MTEQQMIDKLYAIGVVPVVKFDDPATAVPVAKALMDGGVPCIEVTFRTAHAAESIKLICEACPDMLVGAGTVLTTAQVDAAVEAGAKFIVSPGFNPTVVKYCISKNLVILPGCTNAGAVEQALELGLTNLKFFPAEASGGINMIKALAGPFGNVRFMPTGGVNEKNINDYLAFDKIIACGGTYLVTDAIVKSGNYAEITAICKRTIKTILGLHVAHVGINGADEADHDGITDALTGLLLTDKKVGNSSSFVGDIEVTKAPVKGAHGHIAIGTNNLIRAKAYFEAQGYTFDETTAKYKGSKMFAIYFTQEIGGFAYHLVQK